MFQVAAKLNIFKSGHDLRHYQDGTTLAEVLEDYKVHPALWDRVSAYINGYRVSMNWFKYVRPKEDTSVAFVLMPGANLAVGKQYAGSVAAIAFQLGGLLIGSEIGGTAGRLIGAGIGLGGALVAGALVPPPHQPQQRLDFGLAGSRNRATPYEAIPKIYGEHRIFPPLAATPFTEVVGYDQYMRMLFLVGYGPLKLSDFKIGDTSLSEYEDVQIEARRGGSNDRPITLYTDSIFEESIGVKLTFLNQWEKRTTNGDVDEFIVNITFPQGLFEGIQDKTLSARVDCVLQYRHVGTKKWNTVIPPSELHILELLGVFQTIDNLYTQIDTIVSELELLEAYLAAVPALNKILHGTLLNSLLYWINRMQDRLSEFTPEDPDQEAIVDSLADIIAALLVTLAAFTSGNDNDPYLNDDNINRLASFLQILASLYDVNDGISIFAPSLDIPGFYGPLFKYFIHQIGLAPLFGNPPVNGFAIVDDHRGIVRRAYRVPVERGTYEIRIKRASPDNDIEGGGILFGEGGFLNGGSGFFGGGLLGNQSGDIVDQMYWTSLQSIVNEPPVNITGVSLVALRIRASDQLNGVVDQFNCIAKARIPIYDDISQTWSNGLTRSPAWAFADILCGDANKRPIDHSRLDIDRLVYWDQLCTTKGWTYDDVIDDQTTVFNALQDMCPSGRASFTMRNGKYSVVIDEAKSTPVQHFTPRNSWNFSITRVYNDFPHALKVRFINPDAGWQEDEVVVYDDGYDESTATKFETLVLRGITDSDMAWRHGRYYLAVGQLRPEVVELDVDVEHIVCERGDLVLVTHDVPLWGLKWGRIKAMFSTGGNIDTVRIDEKVTFGGDLYAAKFRRKDGTFVTYSLTNQNEETTDLDFENPPGQVSSGLDLNDLVVVGVIFQESEELIVKEISPNSDLSASLTLVHHAPEVHQSDVGEIPPFDSNITIPPEAIRPRPPKPQILDIMSDDYALVLNGDGSMTTNILILVKAVDPDIAVYPEFMQVQYRRTIDSSILPDEETEGIIVAGKQEWTSMQVFPYHLNNAFAGPVTDQLYYDFRIRYISRAGITSEWTEILNYLVEGKSSPPPDITFLNVEPGILRWQYPVPPVDFLGFQVRFFRGTVSPPIPWETAEPLHSGYIGSSSFPINNVPQGVITFLVRAFDTVGNASNIAHVTANLGDVLVDNLLLSVDHYALGFPGDRDNCYKESSGDLVAFDTGTGFWLDDANNFWIADADLFWIGLYQYMAYYADLFVDDTYCPCYIKVDLDVEGSSWILRYKDPTRGDFWPTTLATDDLWPVDLADDLWVTFNQWTYWPGIIYVESERTIRFWLYVSAGTPQGRVNALTFYIDVPDIIEFLNQVDISSGGTRLPITKTYQSINVVNLTLLTYGTAVTCEVSDKNPTSGPLVYCKNTSGTNVGGRVNAQIVGY